MSKYGFEVQRLSGSLGAEIHGVDLRKPISDDLRARLRAAWLEHLVLFFPGQFLNNTQHKAFGAIWGDLVTYEAAPNSAEDPDVVELTASNGSIADIWHTDQTFQSNPPIGSVLNMIKLPACGGDTMWLSQYAAYESLSAPIRNMIDDLTAIHHLPRTLEKSPEIGRMLNRVERPVVDVHPETGRRFLYVNPMYTMRIPQISRLESDALLALLYRHSEDARFTVRYRWSEGTIAIWDNRCTQHCVVNDFDGERIIRRVTIGGPKRENATSPWENYRPHRLTSGGKLHPEPVA